ncbi:MAG: phage terminase small subunit [Pseudohongiella sp.]|nr:phage terminase small subunit [Pseudohongiella sp.]
MSRKSTPAQRHFQRMMSAESAGSATAGQPQTGDQYELMQAALWEARRTLKSIQSIEAKVEKKRELLPDFYPYIEGVLSADKGAQDDVIMTLMVWFFDIGDITTGLAIATYALKHGLKTPDRYQRDTASLVAEQVADESLKVLAQLEQDEASAPDFVMLSNLILTDRLTADADMHDQIRAKLHKAIGFANRQCGRTEEALNHLNRAVQLNEKVGVKKDIEKLARELKKQQDGSDS